MWRFAEAEDVLRRWFDCISNQWTLSFPTSYRSCFYHVWIMSYDGLFKIFLFAEASTHALFLANKYVWKMQQVETIRMSQNVWSLLMSHTNKVQNTVRWKKCSKPMKISKFSKNFFLIVDSLACLFTSHWPRNLMWTKSHFGSKNFEFRQYTTVDRVNVFLIFSLSFCRFDASVCALWLLPASKLVISNSSVNLYNFSGVFTVLSLRKRCLCGLDAKCTLFVINFPSPEL